MRKQWWILITKLLVVFGMVTLLGCSSNYLEYRAVPVETSAEAQPGDSGPNTCFVVRQHTHEGIHSLGVYCKVDPAR